MRQSLFALLAALLIWPTAASAESPAEYRLALGETMRAVEAAMSALPGERPLIEYAPVRLAVQRLEAIGRVTTESGAVVTVDNRAIARQLRGSRAEGRQAYERLRRLVQAVDEAAATKDWVRDKDALASLDEVLARREFQDADNSSIDRFLGDVRSRLFNWLESIFPGIGLPALPGLDLGKPLEAVAWLVAGALVVFTVVFFAFTLRGARRSLMRYAALPQGTGREREDAASALLASQRAADSGDYRLAVHYLYQWAVLHLAENSRLRFDRSLTNREQLRAISEGGEASELVRSAAEAFDRLWYGHAACTEAEYGQFRRTMERLVGATT